MLFDKIRETTDFIKSQVTQLPVVGIILGSGLNSMADLVEEPLILSYSQIPHFPVSTVAGHAGKLIFGRLGGKNMVMMAGRFHYYEGYNMEEVTFPVRVMKALGVQTLLVSNAAGGMDPAFRIGDIMFIRDHINLFPEHPLRGRNDERLGIRFPDMSEPYDRQLLERAEEIAARLNIPVKQGVYVGLQGPTFETRAEYQWLRVIGGDAVGMSTVPEVIIAIHGGMKVFAASIITDLGIREELNVITHEEVLEAAHAAAPMLAAIMTELISAL